MGSLLSPCNCNTPTLVLTPPVNSITVRTLTHWPSQGSLTCCFPTDICHVMHVQSINCSCSYEAQKHVERAVQRQPGPSLQAVQQQPRNLGPQQIVQHLLQHSCGRRLCSHRSTRLNVLTFCALATDMRLSVLLRIMSPPPPPHTQV
jgi:hypothetical protein